MKKYQVKCIDGHPPKIKQDEVYIVTEGDLFEDPDQQFFYIENEDRKDGWKKERFIILTEIETDDSVATSQTNDSSNDWKQWRTVRDGECACGMQRELCDYHR